MAPLYRCTHEKREIFGMCFVSEAWVLFVHLPNDLFNLTNGLVIVVKQEILVFV